MYWSSSTSHFLQCCFLYNYKIEFYINSNNSKNNSPTKEPVYNSFMLQKIDAKSDVKTNSSEWSMLVPVRAVASLSLPGGQDKNISSIFPNFLKFFLNFPSFSSSIWLPGWATRPPGKALATPLVPVYCKKSPTSDLLNFACISWVHLVDKLWPGCQVMPKWKRISMPLWFCHINRGQRSTILGNYNST